MLHKRITIIVIGTVFCTFVMCVETSKNYNNSVQNDIMQYNDKSSQPVDTFVLRGRIKNIKRLYGGNLILHSLNFALRDKFKDFFTFVGEGDSLPNWNDLDWRSVNLYGFDLWIDSVITVRPVIVDSLLFVVQNIKENEAIIKQIWNWCETKTVLEAAYHYGGDADTYPKTLFEMPKIYPVTKLGSSGNKVEKAKKLCI